MELLDLVGQPSTAIFCFPDVAMEILFCWAIAQPNHNVELPVPTFATVIRVGDQVALIGSSVQGVGRRFRYSGIIVTYHPAQAAIWASFEKFARKRISR